MNRDSRRSRRLAHALLAGTFAGFLCPSTGALAQDEVRPAVGTASAAAADSAAQPRRDRRRAAKADNANALGRTETSVAAAATVDAAEADIVCKNIKPLGTRMAKRVCGTPAQWAALEKKTTDAASDVMRQVRGQSAVIVTTPGPAVGPP
jgi:hypothetical protein